MSHGGAGTLFLGSKYLSNWTAIAGIAPAAFLMQNDRKDYLDKMKNANLPAMIAQGGKDGMPDIFKCFAGHPQASIQ